MCVARLLKQGRSTFNFLQPNSKGEPQFLKRPNTRFLHFGTKQNRRISCIEHYLHRVGHHMGFQQNWSICHACIPTGRHQATFSRCLFCAFLYAVQKNAAAIGKTVFSVNHIIVADVCKRQWAQYLEPPLYPYRVKLIDRRLVPLSVVLIERFFFKSHNVSALTFIGLLLGIGGTFIVFYENAFQGARPEGFFFGVFLSFIAMLTWSIGSIIIAKNTMKINPYYSIGWQMLISAAILYLLALATGQHIPLQDIPAKGWGAVAYLVVAGSLITYAAFVYSMKHLPPALFSLYAYFNPLVAMVVAGTLLNEKLNINILWGAIVTLAGVFIVNYSVKRNEKKIMAEPEI